MKDPFAPGSRGIYSPTLRYMKHPFRLILSDSLQLDREPNDAAASWKTGWIYIYIYHSRYMTLVSIVSTDSSITSLVISLDSKHLFHSGMENISDNYLSSILYPKLHGNYLVNT
jgi:hypothetical protein